ncbi:hypothetical protein JD793_004320 [Citrobacter braakii]|nr:hypothetical protein [Citrobacter braakii]
MGDISGHFSRREFACKDGCGFQALDKELLGVLEDTRTHFGAAITIDCACCCPAYNKAVVGAEYSQHLYGMVADIKVSGYSLVGDRGISHPHTLFGGQQKCKLTPKSLLTSTVEKLFICWISSICYFFCIHEWDYFIRYSRFI